MRPARIPLFPLDVVLLPGVVLQGDCVVGGGAEVGPDSRLVDTFVGEGFRPAK